MNHTIQRRQSGYREELKPPCKAIHAGNKRTATGNADNLDVNRMILRPHQQEMADKVAGQQPVVAKNPFVTGMGKKPL
jgi:hypothetical protein